MLPPVKIPRWSLVIHGGAGQLTPDTVSETQRDGALTGLAQALDAGTAILASGGAALDAVAAAVTVLEDDPHFNAGRGAVLSYDGAISLDAAIMDGQNRRAGAAADVSSTRNPVQLARAVMEASPHVLLSGAGADIFAREQGIPPAGTDWFVTEERKTQLAAMLARGDDWFDVDMKYGTVGAVACDMHGHVAAATSTGGVTGKRWGRIGDTPLIGAGTWADDRACAVSCTGSGEQFIRAGVAHDIAARVRLSGLSLQTAADAALSEVVALGGTGGVIVAGPGGETALAFTTPGMYRATATAEGARTIAIFAQ
ncbi:MAG: isoaspartyl peptidase/L-asparaginase family protein [Sphingomonas sp.]